MFLKAQEKMVLKCEETLQLNTTEGFPSSTDTLLLKELEAGSILWDTIDKMIKKNDGEPDDDYATCEKMVHS